MKIRQWEPSCYMPDGRTDKHTDMAKPTVAFRNSATKHKNPWSLPFNYFSFTISFPPDFTISEYNFCYWTWHPTIHLGLYISNAKFCPEPNGLSDISELRSEDVCFEHRQGHQTSWGFSWFTQSLQPSATIVGCIKLSHECSLHILPFLLFSNHPTT